LLKSELKKVENQKKNEEIQKIKAEEKS